MGEGKEGVEKREEEGVEKRKRREGGCGGVLQRAKCKLWQNILRLSRISPKLACTARAGEC